MAFKDGSNRVYKNLEIFALKYFTDERSAGGQSFLRGVKCRPAEIERSGAVYKFASCCGRCHVADDNIEVRSKGSEKIVIH